jgi:hypothetical protein
MLIVDTLLWENVLKENQNFISAHTKELDSRAQGVGLLSVVLLPSM